MAKNFNTVQLEINQTMLKIVKDLSKRLTRLEKKGSKHVTK